MRFAGVFAAGLLLLGCHKPSAATPDAEYRAFAQAVAAAHQGKEEKLLEFFDAPTRAALQARAKAASEATGKNMPDDAAYQLVLGASNVPPLADVKVADEQGDMATVEVVTDGGARGQVKMVREKGRWRIHLDMLPGSTSADGGA